MKYILQNCKWTKIYFHSGTSNLTTSYTTVHKLCPTMDSNREIRHSGMYILRMYERDAFLTRSEVARHVYVTYVCMERRICRGNRRVVCTLYYTWYKRLRSSCISMAEKLVLSLEATRATRCRGVNGAVVLHARGVLQRGTGTMSLQSRGVWRFYRLDFVLSREEY